MCFLKVSALPKELSDRHFWHWTPNSVPKSRWNKDWVGVVGTHAEMGTLVSHPPNLPSVKASPGVLQSIKCPL